MTREQLKLAIECVINIYKHPIECFSYKNISAVTNTNISSLINVYSCYGIEIWESIPIQKLYVLGMTPKEFEIFNDCVSIKFYEKTYCKGKLELEEMGRRIASDYYHYRFQENLIFSDVVILKEILEGKYGVDLLEVSSESTLYQVYKEDNFTSRHFKVSGIKCLLKDEEF